MQESADVSFGDIVAAVLRGLTAGNRAVPDYVVRDAVEAALRHRYPGAVPAELRLPGPEAARLVADLTHDTGGVHGDPATMPAVLDGGEAGQLIAALGVAVHLAAYNLARDRLRVAHVLNAAASALTTLGAASRTAHRDGAAVVLLSPATSDAVRTALATTLAAVRQSGWEAGHLGPGTAESLLGEALGVLGASA